jgi:4'-phosphopantetheinyl transferase EntD
MIAYLLGRGDQVPSDDGWLLPAEEATLAGLAQVKRRGDWRLGRWIAKRAVAAASGALPAHVEIRAGHDGAPYACRAGVPMAATLSISHSAGVGLCVVAMPPVDIGCDLELVEPRADVFEQDWFTIAERKLVDAAAQRDHDLMVTLIWSAKESALKATHAGLRRDTRTVVVDVIGGAGVDGWGTLGMRDRAQETRLEGWWRLDGRFVITTACASMPDPPSPLVDSIDSESPSR